MKDYEKTVEELKRISETLKLFPESLQEKVYDTLISQYLGNESKAHLDDETKDFEKPDKDQTKKPNLEKTKTAKKSVSKKGSYKLLKDLNLKGSGDKPSLKDFVNSKQPRSNIDFNTVSIYYLEKEMNIDSISIDHIYTCYKECDKKVPALDSSLRDTSSSKYGYIEIKNGCYTIPISGENFVEHELPRKKGQSKS